MSFYGPIEILLQKIMDLPKGLDLKILENGVYEDELLKRFYKELIEVNFPNKDQIESYENFLSILQPLGIFI